MSDIETKPYDFLMLPSYPKLAGELTDAELEDVLLAGVRESTPGYLRACLEEWERRASEPGS